MLSSFILSKTVAEVKMIDEAYGEGLVGSQICCEWFTKFNECKFDLDDNPQNNGLQEFGSDDL